MKTLYAAATVALALASAARAQEFAGEMARARALVLEARSGRPWLLSHKNGVLQRINDALAHLNAESKPSIAMVRAGGGSGTGFIVDPAGLMITNAHVVIDAGVRGDVKVVFADGSEHDGVVAAVGSMGTTEEPFAGRDLAIVRLPKRAQGWPALPLGDSAKLREGEMVAVMGYPMGLPFTLTQGVVSGLDAREGGVKGFPVKFVQTDAAINGGNSGGPLVTMDGEVVGVNTLSFSRSGGSDGIGFAVGVDAVKRFLAEFKRRGSFSDQARTPPRRGRGARPGRACPAPESLSRPWVEHSGPLPEAALAAHLRAEPDGAAPALLPVNAVSWWVGASRRGRGDAEAIASPGCFVHGSAALYVNGPEDAPAVDFVSVVGSGGEASLRERLIELRWFDHGDGRKHRWYNVPLSRSLGWSTDGRGAPTDTPRPIPLPDAVNELL